MTRKPSVSTVTYMNITSLTTDELLPFLGLENHATAKERKSAFERVREHVTNNEYAHIIVPSQSQEKILIRTSLDLTPNTVKVFDITVEANGKLELNYFENRPVQEHSLTVLTVNLEENAHLDLFMAFTGSLSSSLFLEIKHIGRGSKSQQKTVFFANHSQQFDIFSTTVLDAPDTHTTITAKGVVSDTAQVRFDGAISITTKGDTASGHLHEHTLLLSPLARVNAIPALKIAHNNVQASHAASVTRIDDEHLFYCAARGIDEVTATRLIVDGFLESVYSKTVLCEELKPIIAAKIDDLE